MRPIAASLAILAPLLLIGAAGTYRAERLFDGIYTSAFEHSEFGGCWLNFSVPASRRFRSLVQPEKYEARRYHLRFVGRKTPRIPNVRPGKGYGHLGMMPCEVEVVRVVSVRTMGTPKP